MTCEGDCQFLRSVRLCAAAKCFQNRYNIALDAAQQRMLEQTLEITRNNLSSTDFDTAWGQGQALTDKQAVDLALEMG